MDRDVKKHCTIAFVSAIFSSSMNSRLIRTLIVVIGIAVGLTASYFVKNIDNDINSQRSSADMVRE